MRSLLCLYLVFTATLNLAANEIRDYWFSGAEINRYELTQTRYGAAHPGHVEFIFVTEPFLTEAQVKNENGTSPSTDVLKLNALRTFNTGIYSYRTMSSTFQPIDLKTFPHSLKTNTSVQDWCGQYFQQFNKTSKGWRGEIRSYFQSEADQDFELGNAWIEDAIWLKLRLNPNELPTGPIQIIPSALHTRFTHTPVRIETATAERIIDGTQSHYLIHYQSINRELQISYDSAFPHIIRSWKEREASGTTKAVLTHRIMNSEYWSEHSPQDAAKRKKLGLAPIPN
ncbi:hypothetical protein QEH59_12395 [Coraliomargarita sp. SDUM461004]|uniref:Septum formation inhibitor Maf n=1 Tax=Thalassobacterium sedimentorum TaxID=3041258 RepID=A0ABU1AK90_9BACT|nr:hypothetical protein [Coraliomargarita sp. SDUM461004]MDQ8195230.1 hypothetical protein [Coraliomargarita sp. SDUM461004]